MTAKTKKSITLTTRGGSSGLEMAVRGDAGGYAVYTVRRAEEAVWLATSLLTWAQRLKSERAFHRRARKAG